MRIGTIGLGLGILACSGGDDIAGTRTYNAGGGNQSDASVAPSGAASGKGGAAMGAGGGQSGGTVSGSGGLDRPALGCVTGTERCPCYGNGTCNGGLVCASSLCVNVNAGGAGGLGGTGGKAVRTGGTTSVGGSSGALSCSAAGTVCSNDPTVCCVGLTCVVDARSPSNGTCAVLCNTDGECASGCCWPLLNGTASVCAPSQYCGQTCRDVGASCLDSPGSCCPGTQCAFDDPSSTIASCAAICDFDAECVSNCCAPSGSGNNVCSLPLYCPTTGNCLPAGTRPCALGVECCPGTYCTSDAINQICLPTCNVDSECSTGCCRSVNGNGIWVCVDPAYCP